MRIWLCLGLSLCAGCASERENIPVYPSMGAPQTLRLLRERSGQIRTISGQGTLRMTSGEDKSIMLDAAVALEPPERARIRAWKLGQAVFDLTLLSQAAYMQAPQDSQQRKHIIAAGSDAARMMSNWMRWVTGSFPASDVEERSDSLLLIQRQHNGMTLVCTIDRSTITPRSYRLLDDQGAPRFVLRLSRYVQSNGQVWPSRLEAKSDAGTLRLDLRELEINAGLPPGAFDPPRRAERLP